MSITHAHIGTGKFGLGFAGYFSQDLGFTTKMLNRTPSDSTSTLKNETLKNAGGYVIEYFNGGENVDSITFDTLDYFDMGNHEMLVDIISSDDIQLRQSDDQVVGIKWIRCHILYKRRHANRRQYKRQIVCRTA